MSTLWPLLSLLCFFFAHIQAAYAERVFFAGYKGGFYIRSEEEGGMELLFGGAFQTDYRYYAEPEIADDGFDIRRARLRFKGRLTRYFRFGMEFEFEGNETNNLVDAYGEAVFGATALRFGQFKEPYSLEWQSADKSQYFAERSMGYYLGPRRDIGIMLHGQWLQDVLNLSIGLFNGDGDDGSASGPEEDAPEIAGRLTFSPFKQSLSPWLKNLQVGTSATYASIDPLNVDLRVKSSGMVGTQRNLYVLSHNTKFGVIQDAERRRRFGLEAAWAVGPAIFQGEYFSLQYNGLEASGDNPSQAEFFILVCQCRMVDYRRTPRPDRRCREAHLSQPVFQPGGGYLGRLLPGRPHRPFQRRSRLDQSRRPRLRSARRCLQPGPELGTLSHGAGDCRCDTYPFFGPPSGSCASGWHHRLHYGRKRCDLPIQHRFLRRSK
jgi:hypothetical protein